MTDSTDRTNTTELRWLRREQVIIGDLQPRKHFEQAKIDNLVASLKEHGFDPGISRLLVRPLGEYRTEHAGEGSKYYIQRRMNRDWETVAVAEDEVAAASKAMDAQLFELVLGECRYRGSEVAGVELLPVVVQEMDDLTALKKQLVENMQRAELTPMEEAMAFQRMRDEMGQSLEEIGKSLGIGPEVVRNRLQLCRVAGSDVAAAIDEGKITATHGLALSRVPSMKLRSELLQKVLTPPDGSSAPWSEERLVAHIRMDYVTDLRFATFDQADPQLVPMEASEQGRAWGGACTDCPFNTFVNPPADGGGRRSVKDTRKLCTNPQCFQAKEIAAHEKWRHAVEEDRYTLSHAENAELWNESGRALAFHSPYVELDQLPATSELRSDVVVGDIVKTWKTLIKDQAVAIVLGRDAAGKVHELVRHDLAKKAAHLNGHKIFRDSEREERTDRERSSTATAPAQSRDERSYEETLEEKRQRNIEALIGQAEIVAIVEAAESKERKGMLQLRKPFWAHVALGLATAAHKLELLDPILARREWTTQDLVEEVKKQTLAQRLGLVVELLVAVSGDADVEGGAPDLWAAVFGVDLKAVRKKAERELRREEKKAA